MSHPETSRPSAAEIGISNLSLPLPVQLGGSLSSVEQYLTDISPTDQPVPLELTPQRSRFMGRLLNRADQIELAEGPNYQEVPSEYRDMIDRMTGLDRLHDWSDEDDAYRRIIGSFHSSFRNDTGDISRIRGAFFPKWPESLRQLRSVQRLVGNRDAVLYPAFRSGTVYYTSEMAPFQSRMFQPCQEANQTLGLSETSGTEKIHSAMKQHGFDDVVLDLGHLLRGIKNPYEFGLRLVKMGWVREIHVPSSRKDLGLDEQYQRDYEQGAKALATSYEAALKTRQGEYLAEILQEARGTIKRIILEEGKLPTELPHVRRRRQRAIMDTLAGFALAA